MGLDTRYIFRKVPEITVYFWVIKILTTAMGEATSDYLVKHINPFLAVGLGGLGLLIALFLQFSVHKYIAWVYWLAAAAVAVTGTMAADALHIQFKIPYVISSTFFGIILIVVFVAWQKSENTLSIHSINCRRRELYYWATVMATFALGTAVGDMTATTLGLGYFSSGLLFSGLILLPALAYWLFGLNEIVAFWTAYVLTRPLGASFADWLGVPKSIGGLGLGRGVVSLSLSFIIVCFVVYLTFTHKDMNKRQTT